MAGVNNKISARAATNIYIHYRFVFPKRVPGTFIPYYSWSDYQKLGIATSQSTLSCLELSQNPKYFKVKVRKPENIHV